MKTEMIMNKDTASEREEREWRQLEKKLSPKTDKCNGKVECKIRKYFGNWFKQKDNK